MSITIEWDNTEQSIIRYTFVGNWTWDELHESLDAGEKMAENSPRSVDAIIDISQGNALPGGSFLDPTALSQAQTLISRAQPKRGQIAVVGASSLIMSMYKMARNMFGDKASGVHFADSIDEARELLTRQQSAPPA